MSNLFDPEAYLDPTRKARRSSKRTARPLNLLVNDGSWVVLARSGGPPYDYAHQVVKLDHGLATAACKLFGRRLEIAPGLQVNACPKCQAAAKETEKKGG